MAACRPPLRSERRLCLQEFSIGSEQIDALYHYAKFQFECGNYSTASEFLYHYRTLSTDPERNMSALWGKLAATVLQQVELHCSAGDTATWHEHGRPSKQRSAETGAMCINHAVL